MSVTLDEITLPAETLWTNEYDGVSVAMVVQFSLTGAQFIQQSAQQAGRSIVLSAKGADYVWITRELAEALRTKAAVGSLTPMTLTLLDGRTFSVAFDHANKAIEATQVYEYINDGSDDAVSDPFTLTIRLITV